MAAGPGRAREIFAVLLCGSSVVAGASGAGGCTLGVTGLELSSEGGVGVDASSEGGDGAADGGEASVPTDGAASEGAPKAGPGPDAIVPVGGVQSATGLAQGAHLVYANHAARWWLFYVSDAQPMALQTLSSADFVTWTPGATLALGGLHDDQGGNFSVAYADLGGDDVVHVTYGLHLPPPLDRHHYHVRATISGSTITFGTPLDLSDIGSAQLVEPDGPAVYVSSDGRVWDASGWATFMGTGNEVAWASTGFDLGVSWDGLFGPQQGIGAGMHTVNARQLATAGGVGTMVALWEKADAEPDPTNVEWSQLNGVGWSAPQDVFPAAGSQSANDWGAATLSNGYLHVVRRKLTGGFEQQLFDGVSWQTAPAPPDDPGLAESGVAVLTDGNVVSVFAIASDAADSVRQNVWNTSAWGAWSTVEGSSVPRRYLSGYASGTHAAIIWTQANGASYEIAGKLVTLQ
jgi:hypothetical protein